MNMARRTLCNLIVRQQPVRAQLTLVTKERSELQAAGGYPIAIKVLDSVRTNSMQLAKPSIRLRSFRWNTIIPVTRGTSKRQYLRRQLEEADIIVGNGS